MNFKSFKITFVLYVVVLASLCGELTESIELVEVNWVYMHVG